jgi:hypothetical protein
MRKLATVGYRVQPRYNGNHPQGTITFVVNDYYVCVLWDGDDESKREPIKFLRKGSPASGGDEHG